MDHFAIFLCMVIGYACVDSQRIEIGEDDSKADQDHTRKAASFDANQTTTEDKAIRSKDDLASAHSSYETSNENEDSEKPSSAAMSMNVTSVKTKTRVLFQADKTQSSIVERKAVLDHRDHANDGIDDLDDLKTYGDISQKVDRGRFEELVEWARLLPSRLENICQRFEGLVENSSTGFCNELKRIHSAHPSYLQTPADLEIYIEMMDRQSDALALFADGCVRYLNGEQTQHEFEEKLKMASERLAESKVHGPQISWILIISLCVVIGIAGIVIFSC